MLLHNEPMSRHCSFRAGGLAEDFFTPETLQDLSDFLKTNQKPLLFLGLGSNLLVRDKGFPGVVIKLSQLKNLQLKNDLVEVEAGVSLAKLSRFCQAHGICGGEFLSAIPGTVGGGLKMNAGAFGAEFWSYVEWVKTIDKSGAIFKRHKDDFIITYRQVRHKQGEEYFIGATLKFVKNSPQNIQELLKKRNQTQPIGQANCGSVFKNPTPQFAAKLIEESDLKGFCIGGACISNKHANFIINQNNATANDIENLIIHIQKTVKSKLGIHLETEVIIQ